MIHGKRTEDRSMIQLHNHAISAKHGYILMYIDTLTIPLQIEIYEILLPMGYSSPFPSYNDKLIDETPDNNGWPDHCVEAIQIA